MELNHEEISVTLEMVVDSDCETIKIDERFISDINKVINVSVEEDHLSLRLHNDNGVMHFEKMKPE